ALSLIFLLLGCGVVVVWSAYPESRWVKYHSVWGRNHATPSKVVDVACTGLLFSSKGVLVFDDPIRTYNRLFIPNLYPLRFCQGGRIKTEANLEYLFGWQYPPILGDFSIGGQPPIISDWRKVWFRGLNSRFCWHKTELQSCFN